MNATRNLFIPFFLLLALSSCSENEGNLPSKKKPLFEVMVIFAPGQLGDRGYADDVMEGVNLLSFLQNGDEKEDDQLDVHFISPWNFVSISQTIEHWVENTDTPFSGDSYSRRLLVLTEPYMVSMLSSYSAKMRSTDEVLLLKVNENDVKEIAAKLGMGNRLHGLNISAANSVRRYCKYVKNLNRLRELMGDNTFNLSTLYYYRLYDNDFMVSRDSVYETFMEELGTATEILTTALSNEVYEGLYSTDSQQTVIDAAYTCASFQQTIYERTNQGVVIVDLGSGNAGWDYWLMNRSTDDDTFHTLVIDSDKVPLHYRIYIKRFFGFALANWCSSWMDTAIGEMDPMLTLSGDDFCYDNIPDDMITTSD